MSRINPGFLSSAFPAVPGQQRWLWGVTGEVQGCHRGGSGVSQGCHRCVSLSPQVFREQAIDGETLPLLTEEHLLNNMGLKLGPALKIRSQVGQISSLTALTPVKAVPRAGQNGLCQIPLTKQ